MSAQPENNTVYMLSMHRYIQCADKASADTLIFKKGEGLY